MRSPVIQIGFLMTLISLAAFIQKPFFMETLSRTAHDLLVRHHSADAQSGHIVIVDLNEASLDQVGQWPWPRYRVADLIQRIFDVGASVVALDITFPEADRTSPKEIEKDIASFFNHTPHIEGLPADLRDWDQILARTLASGKSILGCYMQKEAGRLESEEEDPNYRGLFYTRGRGKAGEHLFHANGLTISLPLLGGAAGNNAFFNIVPDFDGVVRRAPLIWARGENRIYPSLALEAVRMFLDIPQVGIEHEEKGIEGIRLQDRMVLTDLHGQLVINYRSTPFDAGERKSSFPVVSAASILNGDDTASELEGRIVFVGTSAVGLRDLRSTPLKKNRFPGVEINATIADNILAGDYLQDPRWMDGAQIAAILLAGLLLTFSVYFQRSWLAFFEAAGIILTAIAVSLYLLQSVNLLFLPSYVISTVGVMYPVLTMINFWQSERQMRWIRSNFGAMVSNKVLDYIEANPDSVTDKGKHAEATILFSDIQGFTSIAEQLGPRRISDLMEVYMNPMTEIIMKQDGYIDKYIGDMIMAEWGVPFPSEDHAIRACHAALEQLEMLQNLQEEFTTRFNCQINIRIGINTGDVIAGKMGSEKRHQYTVLGDAVNLASRLEPLNKEYGTTCLIGEQTYEQCRDMIQVRKLDLIAVEGKTRPVWIYELLGRAGEVEPATLHLATLYEKSFDAFHSLKDTDGALQFINQALALNEKDAPSLRLKDCILREQRRQVSR